MRRPMYEAVAGSSADTDEYAAAEDEVEQRLRHIRAPAPTPAGLSSVSSSPRAGLHPSSPSPSIARADAESPTPAGSSSVLSSPGLLPASPSPSEQPSPQPLARQLTRGLVQYEMEAVDFADARKEFGRVLERVGAKAGATVVCMKGYGSRMDEIKHPFIERSLALLEGVDVVIWDGDWLKRESFTYVIGEFLRRDRSRRAVGFRKKKGDATKVIKSWTDRKWEKLAVHANELPDPDQVALCFVKPELVNYSRDDLARLKLASDKVDMSSLGWLSSQVSASSRAVSVGGGETCEIEALAWARLREQKVSGQWQGDDGKSIPVWTVVDIGRQGKNAWETPVKLLKIVNREYLGQEVSRFDKVRQGVSDARFDSEQSSLHFQAKSGNHYAVLGLLKSRAVLAKLRLRAKEEVAAPDVKDEVIDERAKNAAVVAKLQQQATDAVVVRRLREEAKESRVEDAKIEETMKPYVYQGPRSFPQMELTITKELAAAAASQSEQMPKLIAKLKALIISETRKPDRRTKQEELEKYLEDESTTAIDKTEAADEVEQIDNLTKLILSCTDEDDRASKDTELQAFATGVSNEVETKVTAGDADLQIANLIQLILLHTPRADQAIKKSELRRFVSSTRARENSLLWMQEKVTLEKLEDRDGWDRTALYVSAMEGKYEAAELLIAAKADVDAETSDERKTPLLAAAENGHGKVAELLINNGADMKFLTTFRSRFENTVMHIAAKEGHVDLVQLLITASNGLIFDTNEDGFTPLHMAADYQQADVTELLIKAKADVYARTEIKLQTPLHIAAEKGYADVACKLIQAEASGWNHLDKDTKLITAAKTALDTKDIREDGDRDIWFVDESSQTAPALVMGSLLRPAGAKKRAGVAAVLTAAGKYDTLFGSEPCTEKGPRNDPNRIHEQCRALRRHLGRTTEEDLAVTVNACIDVLHCGFWTRRNKSVARTFEMAIALSDEAYVQYQRVMISHTAVAKELRQCADRAQHVCVNLLKQLPEEDVKEMWKTEDGKRATWKASALRCAHVIAWPRMCLYMNEEFWGGEESLLNLKFGFSAHARQRSNKCTICCSVAKTVEMRIGWIFTIIVVVSINIVILPIVALVPPLQKFMAEKFVASSKRVKSGLIPWIRVEPPETAQPSQRAASGRLADDEDERQPPVSLYLLDDACVGIFLATVSDSGLTYLIITRLGGVGIHGMHESDAYMPGIVALWLVAALINEVKEMSRASEMDQLWAHYHDPLNKLRLFGIITPLPALIYEILNIEKLYSENQSVQVFVGDLNQEARELRVHQSISEACLAFSIVCWVLTVAMRLLLTHPKMGPLVLVSFKMLDDVKRWMILVGFVIMSFATALNHTFSGGSASVAAMDPACQEIIRPYTEGIVSSATTLVHVILDTGSTNMECFEESDLSLSASMLIYMFQLIVVVLYLNMLIGMMSKTLETVANESVTRQFLFANMVQRYAEAIPAPVSLLSVPFDTIALLCWQCKCEGSNDLREICEACLGLTESSEKEKCKRGKDDGKREALLNLQELKEHVNRGVANDLRGTERKHIDTDTDVQSIKEIVQSIQETVGGKVKRQALA